MPRGRILLKSISQSKKLSLLKTDGARLLYTWLIPHLDVNGCFSGDPAVIRGQIMTRLGKSIDDIDRYLADITDVELIILYEVNGDIFLQVPNFLEKQPNIRPDRETAPTILPPSDVEAESSENYFKKKTIPIDLIRKVSERDGKTCQICGKIGVEDIHFKRYVIEKEKDKSGRDIAFEIDHIIPEYLGGETELENLRLLCRKCNRSKGFKITPAELRRNSGGTPLEVKEKRSKGKGKDNKKLFIETSNEVQLSELLFSLILERDPKYPKPNIQNWALYINLLIRINKRDPVEIEKVIRWCQADNFWHSNILSTFKLREKYSQLKSKMEAQNGQTRTTTGKRTSTGKTQGAAPYSDGQPYPIDFEAYPDSSQSESEKPEP